MEKSGYPINSTVYVKDAGQVNSTTIKVELISFWMPDELIN
jgi:hypothetical protein